MSGISTHVLDTSRGRPAVGVAVRLERRESGGWRTVGEGATDEDGRIATFLPAEARLTAGTYRLRFDLVDWFADLGVESFYPEAAIVFTIRDDSQHYHVPLLLSPFGYTTYRGS